MPLPLPFNVLLQFDSARLQVMRLKYRECLSIMNKIIHWGKWKLKTWYRIDDTFRIVECF